ncbi:MAG: hypothetical protein P4M11_04790, partial [Candidatus Pacebacteria bacterium]|nr:hypothetical protein [Candidatus Paceibacterota bacterium]
QNPKTPKPQNPMSSCTSLMSAEINSNSFSPDYRVDIGRFRKAGEVLTPPHLQQHINLLLCFLHSGTHSAVVSNSSHSIRVFCS